MVPIFSIHHVSPSNEALAGRVMLAHAKKEGHMKRHPENKQGREKDRKWERAVMAYLAKHGTATGAEMARATGTDATHIGAVARHMLADGLIEDAEADRRQRWHPRPYRLTPAGWEASGVKQPMGAA